MVIQYKVPEDLEKRFEGLSEQDKCSLISKALKDSLDTITLKYMYLDTLIGQQAILNNMNNLLAAAPQVEKPKPKPTVTKRKPKPVAVNTGVKNIDKFKGAFECALK